jgi:predicted DNA-binding antitoxin AbrB/MazE fold protein
MSQVVTAVYENGVLRPLSTLNLREHQRVRIHVLPEKPISEAEEAIQVLVEAGLMRRSQSLGPPPPDPISEQERQELANILGQAPGKPLSELIIEDRGER